MDELVPSKDEAIEAFSEGFFSPEAVRREQAAYELHKAQAWPREPEHVKFTRAALRSLVARTGGWDGMKRDDMRLARHYLKTIEANEPDIVAHAVSLGLLESIE